MNLLVTATGLSGLLFLILWAAVKMGAREDQARANADLAARLSRESGAL